MPPNRVDYKVDVKKAGSSISPKKGTVSVGGTVTWSVTRGKATITFDDPTCVVFDNSVALPGQPAVARARKHGESWRHTATVSLEDGGAVDRPAAVLIVD